MEPWTGSANSGVADVVVAIFTLFVVIGLIMFAAKMIFRGNAEGVREVKVEEKKEED